MLALQSNGADLFVGGELERYEYVLPASNMAPLLTSSTTDVETTDVEIRHSPGSARIHSGCERARCTISTKTLRVSAGLLTSRRNAMRVPRMPSWVFNRT